MTEYFDPWDSAENAKEPVFSNVIWGQCEASSWFCVLEKGIGKMEFDPQQHSPDQKRTAIDIIIHPLPEMNLMFDLTRNMIAESREWAGVVLPSIRELEISPKQLNGSWVKVQTVPLTDHLGNTITYTDKNGTVKEKTTIKFLKIFKDQNECLADYIAESSKPVIDGGNGKPSNGNGGDKERQTALKFLRVFVQNECKNTYDIAQIRAALATKIASQPLINKFFTIDSPEVDELIAEFIPSL